ncbi:MAG: hypothetical protein M1834_008724 [Cirrosporium novae-zelandiae]|nr:MAG: hypothetical protein M1834_008724 [Cirrosporium novae-zelandiae]
MCNYFVTSKGRVDNQSQCDLPTRPLFRGPSTRAPRQIVRSSIKLAPRSASAARSIGKLLPRLGKKRGTKRSKGQVAEVMPPKAPTNPPVKRSYSEARDSPDSSANPSVEDSDDPHGDQPSGFMPTFLQLSQNQIHAKYEDLEWRQRARLLEGLISDDPLSQWAQENSDEVKERNRYRDVQAWANCRIHLQVPDGHCDYINASPILLSSQSGKTESRFIATQGPKESHFSHLWRMVWHETAGVAVIVMLTQTEESGREKCFQYFPMDEEQDTLEVNGHDEFGDGIIFTIKLLESEYNEAARSTIRKISLTVGDETREIWHFLFCGWPDFGVPENEDRIALLELIRLSAKRNTNPENPRIIHCSAGVGRSGTFIALDYLLDELRAGSIAKTEGEADPIFDTVDALREQRMMMVQSEPQYQFIYDVLKEIYEKYQSEEGLHDTIAAAEDHTSNGEPSHKVLKITDEHNTEGPLTVHAADYALD